MNYHEKHRPKSKDPEFWDVWVNEGIEINWKKIADDWQEKKDKTENI
ncbi:MAG: hypothetical protein KatS3mg028_0262 [Bacteroidia bacterium]|nr:MAG: hypothetical protein KatS3mg028_0262 [Bacteroidia bacterium]